MTVYVVALININDRERYGHYEAGFMEIFQQYQGTLLSVDEAPTTLEGDWPYTRTVLIEFPDQQALKDWYYSDAYQALAQHRFAASTAAITVLAGRP